MTWINFNKSTIMKKMIVDKTSKDIRDDYEYWIKIVQERLKSKTNKTNTSFTASTNPDLF